jgi:hypothetical protein
MRYLKGGKSSPKNVGYFCNKKLPRVHSPIGQKISKSGHFDRVTWDRRDCKNIFTKIFCVIVQNTVVVGRIWIITLLLQKTPFFASNIETDMQTKF